MENKPPSIFLADVDGNTTCLFQPESDDCIIGPGTQMLNVSLEFCFKSSSAPVRFTLLLQWTIPRSDLQQILLGPKFCDTSFTLCPPPNHRQSNVNTHLRSVGDPEKQLMVVAPNGTINITLDNKSNNFYTSRALGMVLLVGAFGVLGLAIYLVVHSYL
ncbi:hypothetical protein B0H13DRAFT_2383778 [Mycena leptocephala]|nr:hypothetical protein B0H13DRAFT_2383778 [Mycena leptocephala]